MDHRRAHDRRGSSWIPQPYHDDSTLHVPYPAARERPGALLAQEAVSHDACVREREPTRTRQNYVFFFFTTLHIRCPAWRFTTMEVSSRRLTSPPRWRCPIGPCLAGSRRLARRPCLGFRQRCGRLRRSWRKRGELRDGFWRGSCTQHRRAHGWSPRSQRWPLADV